MSDYIDVKTLKSKLSAKLHGANLNKAVGDVNDKLREAAATMLGRIDPPDTICRYRIDNAIYDRVYNYTCPSDLKGRTRIVDIRPIGTRTKWDEPIGSGVREFDIKKERDSFVVEMISGVKSLRISKAIEPGQILLVDLNSLSLPTASITSGGDVQNLVIDTLDYITSTGSLSFGLSGATGQGNIAVTLSVPIDLSTLLNLGSIFAWEKFPDATRLTNITLQWGNSPSAYWSKVITVPQGRTAFDSNAWNLLRADWTSASVVGSPSSTSITYLNIIFNYTAGAALTFAKIDSITASLGRAYEMLYYSNRIFKDASTGALKIKPTLDSDLITLDESALNIYMGECRRVLAAEIKGKNMAADIAAINYELEGDGRVVRGNLVMNRTGLYRDYVSQNPSDAIPPQETYHEFDDIGGEGIDTGSLD